MTPQNDNKRRIGEELLNCFRLPCPTKQLEELLKLQERIGHGR